MVSEVECPHCHSKVVPRSRFSAFTFAILLFLGVLPFILTLTSYLLVFDVFRLMLEKKPESFSHPSFPPFPAPSEISPIPSEITKLMQRAMTSIVMLSFSYLLLTLIVGIIPAVVYLAVRRGSYKCPECNLPMD